MVEDVLRLMDHLGIQKHGVAGYSMGGSIALKLVVNHPQRVNCVVLCGWVGAKRRALYRFWETEEGKRFKRSNVPPACENSFPELSVTEAKIKAVTIPRGNDCGATATLIANGMLNRCMKFARIGQCTSSPTPITSIAP